MCCFMNLVNADGAFAFGFANVPSGFNLPINSSFPLQTPQRCVSGLIDFECRP